MDNRGNLYEREENSQLLRDLEKEGVIKNVSEVDGLVPLTPDEAALAKTQSVEDRLEVYRKKLGTLLDDGEVLTEPLTREEREAMNALSTEVYGKKLAWQKMLRKGEYRPTTIQTSHGDALPIKQLHRFTVNEIRLTMKKILAEREEAAKVAEAKRAEERAKQQAAELAAKGTTDEQSTTNQSTSDSGSQSDAQA